MSKDLKYCPFCGGEIEYRQNTEIEGFCCTNIKCGAVVTFAGFDNTGPIDIIAAWNRRYSEPLTQPEPLSLEKLQGMDGKPVWIKEFREWAIVVVDSSGTYKGMPFVKGKGFEYNVAMRKLTCYTRKPSNQPAKTARIIDDTPHPFPAGAERYVCSACGVRVKRGDEKCAGCGAVFEEGDDDEKRSN